MRKWEDIVKERLEGYESALPAGNFADFRARRGESGILGDAGEDVAQAFAMPSGSAGHLPAKRSALPWALAIAVAAGLAAVLLLRRPASPGDGVQPARQPLAPIAVASDTAEVSDPLQPEHVQKHPYIAYAVTSKAFHQPTVTPQEQVITETVSKDESRTQEPQGVLTPDTSVQQAVDTSVITGASPYIPETAGSEPLKMHFEPSAGLFAGGGLVAALATAVVNFTRASGSDPAIVPQTGPVDVGTPHLPQYISSNSYSHSLPFKGGFSVGISVANKTRITTGIQYITYRSSFTDILSKTQIQRAHYLSVPVRLDKILADNGRLEAYVGGGLEGDFCIAASLSGKEIDRDGFSISLLGAGGIQFNVSKHLGLYVEPEMTWTLPSETRTLQTYRSVNPFMFSINTGLRITMGNN